MLHKTPHIALGIFGENLIEKYLINQNYTIIARNFIYHKKFGEIDIIAQKENILAFIEVKTRNNNFTPIDKLVSQKKQNNIIKTAECFLMHKKLHSQDFIIRFDIAYLCNNNIQYFANAFTKETL